MSIATGRPLHPRHGPHEPVERTPERRPGSVRRTTTVDLLRPGGMDGEVIADARGRDLVTAGDGAHEVVATSSVRGRIDFAGGCALREIHADPAPAGLDGLIGAPVAPGFRKKVAQAVPDAAGERALVHLLLDDLPGAVLVSGYAVREAQGGHLDLRADRAAAEAFITARADLCAGFARSASMLAELAETGLMPMPTGPVAPELRSSADPLGWHEHGDLPPGGIRRRRRMDLAAEGGRVRIEAMFRDTHADRAGVETIIHEYTLDTVLDPAEMRVLSIEATPRVLPWVECPAAAAGAGALAGRTVHDLRQWVRARLSGTRTCTHLNDLLRSLNDTDHLVTLLP